MRTSIIIHYSEIGLKGKNRPDFERILIRNIRNKISEFGIKTEVKRGFGRIVILLGKEVNNRALSFFNKKRAEIEEVISVITKIPGIAYVGVGFECGKDIKVLEGAILKFFRSVSGQPSFNITSFRVDSRRSDKSYPLTSQKINEILGETILREFGFKVNLSSPDMVVWVEVAEKSACFYTEKNKGIGGLPVGAEGEALSLLSSGIDSPVASYLMMKRGMRVDFIHFHSYPYTSRNSVEQVKRIIGNLSAFNAGKAKLYLVSFAEIQKEIIARAPERARIILYRRVMLQIADAVVGRESVRAGEGKGAKYEALVTGESLGQVASQTIKNITTIEDAAKTILLRPLIGFNKEEIINIAKSIGTYEISIEPHDDCCSFMMPRYVLTGASLGEIKKAERNLPIGDFIKKALAELEVFEI